nr:DUF4393 domain-containing protein [Oceanococcus sp. HetDA_MAG_MS8]
MAQPRTSTKRKRARTQAKRDQLPAPAERDRDSALVPAMEIGRGLFGRLQNFAARLPGADLAAEALASAEQIAIRELRNRLHDLDDDEKEAIEDTPASLAKRLHPQILLSSLLDEAVEQHRDEALRCAYTATLLQLTPDQALLLAALSDGGSFALVHLVTASALGRGERVAGHFCTLARKSPVKVREHVPRHIVHMQQLGLVQTGPEDKSLEMDYQTLEGDPQVRKLISEGRGQGRNLRPQRQSLRISTYGRDLWDYCASGTAAKGPKRSG